MMVVDPPRRLVSVDAAVQTTILVRGDHRVVTDKDIDNGLDQKPGGGVHNLVIDNGVGRRSPEGPGAGQGDLLMLGPRDPWGELSGNPAVGEGASGNPGVLHAVGSGHPLPVCGAVVSL